MAREWGLQQLEQKPTRGRERGKLGYSRQEDAVLVAQSTADMVISSQHSTEYLQRLEDRTPVLLSHRNDTVGGGEQLITLTGSFPRCSRCRKGHTVPFLGCPGARAVPTYKLVIVDAFGAARPHCPRVHEVLAVLLATLGPRRQGSRGAVRVVILPHGGFVVHF